MPQGDPSGALAVVDGPEVRPEGADAPYPPPEGLPCLGCGELVPGNLDDCPGCAGGPELGESAAQRKAAAHVVGMAGVTVVLALKLVPGMNVREHWRTRRRRVEREHDMVLGALRATGSRPPPLPITLEIDRTGWCELDADNVAGACKGVIDSACRWAGVDDRNPGVHVHLAQRTTRERRVERYGRAGRYQRTVPAALVTLTVRPWRPEDTTDRLRVLARGTSRE